LESSVNELSPEEGQAKKYLQLYPRKPMKPLEPPNKDEFDSKENYQKVKKLREVVAFAIEKALDDLHYITLKLDEAQTKEEMLHIAQVARNLLQVFSEEPSSSDTGASDAEHGSTSKASSNRKIIDAESEKVNEKIKALKAKLEVSTMEKAVDIARSIRYVKKDLQDFFSDNQIPLPPEVQPPPSPGDDKFVALKKMMLSTLDRIQTQAAILSKEASEATDNQEKVTKILDKLGFIFKSFA
jgi:hypothetical protein